MVNVRIDTVKHKVGLLNFLSDLPLACIKKEKKRIEFLLVANNE